MLFLRFPLIVVAEKLQAIVELSVVQLEKLGNKWLIRSMFIELLTDLCCRHEKLD